MVASVGRQPARGLTPASLYSRAVSVCRGVSSQGVSSPGVSSQGVYSPGVNSQDFPAQAFSPNPLFCPHLQLLRLAGVPRLQLLHARL